MGQSVGSGRTTDRVRDTTTGVTATSTPSATISRTTSASGRMTTSAEICLIRDHRDTSARANLEVPHLTSMNAATTHQHLCLALATSGLRCDEHENTIEHIEHISSRSDCQAICQNHEGCEFFSHAMDHEGHNGECWLHYNCDRLVEHECEDCLMRPGHKCGCFCGPKFPDLDDCSEGPATASP